MAGISSINNAIPVAAPESLVRTAERILQGSREEVPVLTGKLKNSLRITERGEGFVAGGSNDPRVDYARTVHDGLGRGKNMVARPFVTRPTNIFAPLWEGNSGFFLTSFRAHHAVTS